MRTAGLTHSTLVEDGDMIPSSPAPARKDLRTGPHAKEAANYVGDIFNDELLFAAFPLSVGVGDVHRLALP